jgi:hypothetical protein
MDMTCFKIPAGKSESDVTLKQLYDLMDDVKNRLPVIDSENHAKYMIHLSMITGYLNKNGKLEDSLQKFIDDKRGDVKAGFGLNEGFIIMGENTPMSEAKDILDKNKVCQDIFITKDGRETEPITGWISNTRLGRLLQV